MSGVNAAGTLATLPIAAIVVLDQLRRPHGRRLAAWWALGVAAACAWWMVPLLLLGKYSPPFLDFIETANATTFPTGWANDLRGADHWLSYYAIGDQPWWPGAHQICHRAGADRRRAAWSRPSDWWGCAIARCRCGAPCWPRR